MKASELRIGNYHLYCIHDELDNPKDYEVVDQIDAQDLVWLSSEAGENDDQYKPIPLTEDWLKRFGFFKERKRPSRYHKNFFSIEFNDSNIVLAYAPFRKDWGFYIEYIDSPDPKDNKTKYFVSCGIKYVHQLQNLYFALTGEEFKLREE